MNHIHKKWNLGNLFEIQDMVRHNFTIWVKVYRRCSVTIFSGSHWMEAAVWEVWHVECPECQSCECWVPHPNNRSHFIASLSPHRESSGALMSVHWTKVRGHLSQQELSFPFSDGGGVFSYFFPHKLRSLEVCILCKQVPSCELAAFGAQGLDSFIQITVSARHNLDEMGY